MPELPTLTEIDWSALPTSPLVTPTGADDARIAELAEAAAAAVRSSGVRARVDVKKHAWTAISAQDAAWAGSFVHRVATGELTVADLETALAAAGGAEPS